MELKVADEQSVALADEADITSQIIIQEDGLRFIFVAHLVAGNVAFGHGVIVVQSIDFPCLHKVVVHVLLHVKRVHVNKLRRLRFLEEFLLERVAVLAVVDDHFACRGAGEPLVVWFQEAHVERVESGVEADQVRQRNCQRVPRFHKNENYLPILRRAQQLRSTGQDLYMVDVVLSFKGARCRVYLLLC